MTSRLVADAVLPCDEAMTVHRPGIVEIADDGRIAAVGPYGGPVEGERRIGGLLMPGLVNTHCHSPMTLLRGQGEGLPLGRWLAEVIWPREGKLVADDVYWGMTLAAAELLRFGVTTSCEMYFHPDAMARAVREAGGRCLITPPVVDAPWEWLGSWRQQIDAARDFITEHDDADQRVTGGVCAHSAYAVGEDALRAVGDLGRETGALVSIHVAETEHEGDAVSERHGGASVPQVLADLGLLPDNRVLAAHGVWLSDADIALFAEHRVAVAHCPGSNAKLASGIARLRDLLDAGLVVGLGTDGPASGDDLDLWEEMRLAALLARLQRGDPRALSATETLALATRGGAAALGLDVGVLAPGRWADVVRIDLSDPGFVPTLSDADVLAHLVWSAPRTAVRDVWVAGEQVVANGRCTRVDVAEASRRAQECAARLSTDDTPTIA